MSDDGRTVIDALVEIEEVGCADLLEVLRNDDRDISSLAYESIARPCKLSGGEVCLRLWSEYEEDTRHIRWRPQGWQMVEADGYGTGPVQAVAQICKYQTFTHLHIEPVLVDDTPFGGDGHE